jgi:hypothetical protein
VLRVRGGGSTSLSSTSNLVSCDIGNLHDIVILAPHS